MTCIEIIFVATTVVVVVILENVYEYLFGGCTQTQFRTACGYSYLSFFTFSIELCVLLLFNSSCCQVRDKIKEEDKVFFFDFLYIYFLFYLFAFFEKFN